MLYNLIGVWYNNTACARALSFGVKPVFTGPFPPVTQTEGNIKKKGF